MDMRGGAPGTRESDSLDPVNRVDRVDAVVLAGGSVFGLDAAGAIVPWLAAQGRGLPVAGAVAPIVPAAILFDLNNGGDKGWGETPPYRRLGLAAAQAAASDFVLGNAGAGLGARAGRLKGGLGSASALSDDGLQVGALVAANPVGSVVMPGSSTLWAWAWEQQDEMGGQRPPGAGVGTASELPPEGRIGGHTTIGVVATNARLDKAGARRIAIMAQDGLARAIRPVHTPFDGDTIYVLSTGTSTLADPEPLLLSRIGSLAADCVARAIGRAVWCAESLGDMPSYRSRYGRL